MPPPKQKKESPYKTINGQIVKPIRYVGFYGDYMAGADPNGTILEDKDGRPIPYKNIVGDKKPF